MNPSGRLRVLFLVLVLSAIALVPSANASSTPRRRHVRPGPNAISKAMERANPGDTLVLHRGRYREAITITKRLRLVAASDGIPTIDGQCDHPIVVAVRAPGVVLRGLRVQGADGGVSYAVDFRGVASGAARGLITKDTCGNAFYGINVFQTGPVRVVGNRSFGFHEDAAIYVGSIANYPGDARILVQDNEAFDSDKGIIIEETVRGTVRVEGNKVHDNDTTGIWLNDADGVQVRLNSVTDNGPKGIHLGAQSDDNSIRDNTVSGHVLDLDDDGSDNCWRDNTYTTSDPMPPPSC